MKKNLSLLLIIFFFIANCLIWILFVPIPKIPPDSLSHFNPDEWNHIAIANYYYWFDHSPPYNYHYFLSLHPPLYHFSLSLIYRLLFPYLNYLNIIIVFRIVSLFLGLGIIFLCYKSGQLLTNERNSLLSSFIISSIPMFISLSSSVSNEILAAFGSSLCIYAIIKSVTKKLSLNIYLLLIIGTVIAINTKISTIGLLLSGVTCILLSKNKNNSNTSVIVKMILYLTIVTSTLTPWLIKNYMDTGDILKWNTTKIIISKINQNTAVLPSVTTDYFFKIIIIGWKSFWGVFNAMRQPLHQNIYVIILIFQILSIYGVVKKFKRKISGNLKRIIISITPLYLTIIFSFTEYNMNLFTPQGRYFFPLLIPFSLSYVYGWSSFSVSENKLVKASYVVFMILLSVFLVIILPRIIFPIMPN